MRLTTDPKTHANSPQDSPVILHVRVAAGRIGGPDKTILRSAAHANRGPFEVHAAYILPKGDPLAEQLKSQAAELNCPLTLIHERGAFDLQTITALTELCKKLNVAIWHGHDYKSNAMGLLVRRHHPMKLVTTMHGWTNETLRTRLYQQIDKRCISRYEQVIAVSPPLRDAALRLGVAPENLHHIPNGIEIEKYQRSRSRSVACKQLGITDCESPVIGIVGRLSREKGVERAVHMLAAMRDDNIPAQLLLVGDGPERVKLQTLVAQLDLTSRVRFWGWQTDLHRYYEAMDLLLIPSWTEGLPNTMLEAMALEVPVAATDVGAIRQVLDDGRCGVILSDDVQSWITAIAPLMKSTIRRASLIKDARSRVESEFTFDKRVASEAIVHARALGLDENLLTKKPSAKKTGAINHGSRRAA